ncbi:MAG: sensor histidine kinase [Myxococcota bacterium]
MQDKARQALPSFPSIALTIALLLTLAAFFVEGWYILRINAERRSFLERDLQLQRLDGTLIHLDEALTMSALMASATGDPRWETRYRQLEPRLAAGIADAIRLARSVGAEEAARAVDAANLILVDLEYQAFERVRQGDREAAERVLQGEAYSAQKRRYADGMTRVAAALQAHTRDSLSRHRQMTLFALATVLLALPVLLFAWWTVLRHIRRYLLERREAEDKLRASETQRLEALRQSDAIKSTLLFSMSHELRTPLAAMKSFVSSLQDADGSGTSPPRAEMLQGIDLEIDAMSRLVDNLLDMFRIEASAFSWNREWQPLEDAVDSALRSLGRLLESRPLRVRIPADLPPLFIDGVAVQKSLVALLDNAVKYSPPGSAIELAVEWAGQEVAIRVSNEGQQIPPEELPKLFERFYRPISTRESQIRGLGLGLAICRSFVERHGGQVQAESTPEGRTTIGFTLPVVDPRLPLSSELFKPSQAAEDPSLEPRRP